MFVSLGWNCNGAIYRKNTLGLSEERGYKTLPFDIAATSYEGLCECLQDDFSHFFDNLRIAEDGVIMNYYGMWFNHESPILQTTFPKNHFVDNCYQNFKTRYQNRIQNFYDYINLAIENNNLITFICINPNTDFTKLDRILSEKFPKLKYKIFGCVHPLVARYSFYDHFRTTVIDVERENTKTIYNYDKRDFPSKDELCKIAEQEWPISFS